MDGWMDGWVDGWVGGCMAAIQQAAKCAPKDKGGGAVGGGGGSFVGGGGRSPVRVVIVAVGVDRAEGMQEVGRALLAGWLTALLATHSSLLLCLLLPAPPSCLYNGGLWIDDGEREGRRRTV